MNWRVVFIKWKIFTSDIKRYFKEVFKRIIDIPKFNLGIFWAWSLSVFDQVSLLKCAPDVFKISDLFWPSDLFHSTLRPFGLEIAVNQRGGSEPNFKIPTPEAVLKHQIISYNKQERLPIFCGSLIKLFQYDIKWSSPTHLTAWSFCACSAHFLNFKRLYLSAQKR